MIAVVEVDLSLARPPRVDATVRTVVGSDLVDEIAAMADCEQTAIGMVNAHAPARLPDVLDDNGEFLRRGARTGRPSGRLYGGAGIAMVVGCRTVRIEEI